MRKLKICVVTPVYGIAGVPLAQLRFARALAAAGHEVDLIIGWINSGCNLPKIEGFNLRVLHKRQVRSMLIPLARYLKEESPDVVFSAEDHLNIIVLLAALISGSKAKISGSSRVPPSDTYSKVRFTKGWFFKILLQAVWPRANALTCVSEDMVEQYRQIFKSPPHVCVYNIIDNDQVRCKLAEPVDEEWLSEKSLPVIIAAGTLTTRKGFADLVLAMKEVTKLRRARLIILGDGPLRAELEALTKNLDLNDVVKLLGNVDNPLKYFSRADVFVLSSYAEGLPNVLVEAMISGCTPVSTDCPTGPREVLQDGKVGYLVPVRDPIRMAAGIVKALDNPISKSCLRDAVKPFAEHAVLERHFEILGFSGHVE